MEWEKLILWAGGLAGAIGAIWKIVLPLYHWFKTRAAATAKLSEQIGQGFSKMSGEIADLDIKIADLDAKITLNRRDILKSEILWLLKHEPTRIETIENKFKEYRDHGGNSYICEMIEVWREEFAPRAIKERVWGQK